MLKIGMLNVLVHSISLSKKHCISFTSLFSVLVAEKFSSNEPKQTHSLCGDIKLFTGVGSIAIATAACTMPLQAQHTEGDKILNLASAFNLKR